MDNRYSRKQREFIKTKKLFIRTVMDPKYIKHLNNTTYNIFAFNLIGERVAVVMN